MMFWRISVYVCMYLYIAAVSREVELQDESGDVAAVNQSVQTRPCAHVVNIHRVLHRTNRQQPPVRTEPAHTHAHTHLLFITYLEHIVYISNLCCTCKGCFFPLLTGCLEWQHCGLVSLPTSSASWRGGGETRRSSFPPRASLHLRCSSHIGLRGRDTPCSTVSTERWS